MFKNTLRIKPSCIQRGGFVYEKIAFWLRNRSADVLSRFARTINSPALRTDDFFFCVSIDTFFVNRACPHVDYETEMDAENGYLKKLIKYQETEMSTYKLLHDTNDYLVEQLKHRVAELESRLKYIEAHPDVIGELKPLPRFELIVPAAKIHPDVKVYTNPTPEERKQKRIKKKIEKQAEAEIRKETLPD